MPSPRDFVFGSWRAVPVLGVTQILCWGILFYPPVLTLPLIAADRGWSLSFAMSGFSVGLLAAGLVAPSVGKAIDKYGGHVVMTIGSLIGATGLFALVHASHPVAYLAVWIVIGIATSASLYDSAFATLGRIFGPAARRPITVITFFGGLASTAGWPATYLLLGHFGWRSTYLVFALLLCFVTAPLHAFALPRRRADPELRSAATPVLPAVVLPAHGTAFLLVVAGFAAYAFIPSGLSSHLLAIFRRAGIDAATVVTIGALFGPAQVTARLFEFAFAGNAHPLNIARSAFALVVFAFVLLAIAGISAPIAAVFYLMFGVANGLVTIARGTVPLALFGAVGYGRLVGRIAGPWLVMQAAAPLVLAFAAEQFSDAGALALAALFAVTALVCFVAISRPEAARAVAR